MQIGITGATGFLGRYIVRRLAAAGHRLRCWHRPSSLRSGFGDAAAAIDWLAGDLGNPAAMAPLVQGADAVIHAAVDWDGPRNRQREATHQPYDHNLAGSLQLFHTAFRAGVPRFIFISTCAVHEVIL